MEANIKEAISISRQIIATAEAEAAETKALAEQACEQIKRQAYVEGVRRVEKDFAACCAKAERALPTRLREIEGQLLKLLVKLTQEIVGDELSARPESLLSRISRALPKFASSKQLRVLLGAEDFERFASNGELVLSSGSALNCDADSSLAAGSALIESNDLTVRLDCRRHLRALEIQLSQHWEALSATRGLEKVE